MLISCKLNCTSESNLKCLSLLPAFSLQRTNSYVIRTKGVPLRCKFHNYWWNLLNIHQALLHKLNTIKHCGIFAPGKNCEYNRDSRY
jgi:hypothetical protein